MNRGVPGGGHSGASWRWQLRQRAFGRCVECHRPAVDSWRCAIHQEANRRRQREYARLRRILGALAALAVTVALWFAALGLLVAWP